MNEPLDPKEIDQEKEMLAMWQANTMPGMGDPSQLAREIAGRVNQFDRRVFWRNFREYAAGAVLFVWFGYQLFDPAHRTVAAAGLVVAGFIMAYLWLQHRRTRPLDPVADARNYHSQLLKRYDDQIKLLRTVKYWYVLPVYVFCLIVLVNVRSAMPGGSVTSFVVVTAFCGFIAWLNEGYGVRKLKTERREAESLLEEQDQ